MKILHLAIIIGISVTVAMTTVFLPYVQSAISPIHVEIDGLNDTYQSGEPIDFFANATGYGPVCVGPVVKIFNTTNQVVWQGHYPAYSGMGCNPHTLNLDFHAGGDPFAHSPANSQIVLTKTGKYIVNATVGNTFSVQEFSVIPSGNADCHGKEISKNRNGSLVVLLMSPNSTATVCTTYQFNSSYKGGMVHFGFSLGPKFNVTATPSLLNITNASKGDTFSVMYTISSASDSKGIHDYSIPWDTCEQYPLAVGYHPSDLKKSDFPLEVLLGRTCPNSILHVASNKMVSGMNYTEVIINGQ